MGIQYQIKTTAQRVHINKVGNVFLAPRQGMTGTGTILEITKWEGDFPMQITQVTSTYEKYSADTDLKPHEVTDGYTYH